MPYNNYNNNRNRNNNHRQDNNNHRQGNNAQTAVEIKAPFNFVPLPDVGPFIPSWGNQVSQDYPFKDGVSGKITLDIAAMTDIFVRDSKSDSLFHNVNGKYFIPGSSIKGMLRSTLEIVTFGKLRIGKDKINKGKKGESYLSPIPKRFTETKGHDMAELIFGYTDDDNSLKGRVHVGHAFAISDEESPVKELETKEFVMGSPKPSYSPIYIKVKYKDNRRETIISGYKRYPTREEAKAPEIGDNVKDKLKTSAKPLPKGTKFKSEIIFHNLKPEELGAILYILSSEKIEYHQLGGMKPYGYGKVKIKPTLQLRDSQNLCSCEKYRKQFTQLLDNTKGYNNWQNFDTIKELKAMAKGINSDEEDMFKYMTLQEYKAAKRQGLHLKYFTEIKQRK
jgi:CRISPR/Cas system CSM-associated protein Csm3 (group 7 of RAMP superfamily)